MSIQSEIERLTQAKREIRQAIQNKGVGVPEGTPFRQYAEKIGQISGGAVVPKDINFYGYDGELAASWTLEELAAATALPEDPPHEGLTPQGWNWTLEELKSEMRPIEVGQLYITDDGKTRFYIRITDVYDYTAEIGYAEGPEWKRVAVSFNVSAPNSVRVDWGDGSPAETSPDPDASFEHTYAEGGDYLITVEPLGDNGGFGTAMVTAHTLYPLLRRVEFGKNAGTIYTDEADILEGITFPRGRAGASLYVQGSGNTLLKHLTFQPEAQVGDIQCIFGLRTMSLPKVFSPYGDMWPTFVIPGPLMERICAPYLAKEFIYASSDSALGVQTISLPTGTETVIFGGESPSMPAVSSLTIPATVKTLSNAFYALSGLRELHMKPPAPPETSPYRPGELFHPASIPTVYVPVGSLEAYQTAPEWNKYASCMREEGS